MPMDHLGVEELRAVLRAGRSLVSRIELDDVLERLLVTACDVTGARYAAIGVLDRDRRRLERFLTHGVDERTHAAIGDLPHGRGVLGVLIERPQALRLDDVREHPDSYGFPDGHPPMETFLGVPVTIGGEVWGNLYLTEREGGAFTKADEQAAALLADWAAIAVDNAHLHADTTTRRRVAEQTLRRLDATTDLVRALGADVDLDRVLEMVVTRARAIVAARAVVLLLTPDDGRTLQVAAAAGEVDPSAQDRAVPTSSALCGYVLESGASLRLDEVEGRLREGDHALGVAAPRTALLVPLGFRGRPLGVLAAFDHLDAEPVFHPDDQALLEAFAAGAATAVATARSVAEERLRESLRAAEEERSRWARELHDETLQALAGLRLQLAGARGGGPEDLRRAVDEAVAQLDTEIKDLRTLITELRPAALDDLGLAVALEGLVDRLRQAAAGVAVTAHLDVPDRLGGELETAVYRLVQEALTNAARHADARHVEVRVHVDEDEGSVRVRVRDDGRGFDTGAPAGGFGLLGMRERVALAHGDLSVRSRPGGGTEVRAVLPLS